MNRFKVLLMMLFLGVVGCTKIVENKKQTQTETIYAALLSQDKVYVLGELYDYEFDGSLVRKGDDLEKLNLLLRSKFAKYITQPEITSLKITDNQTASATFELSVNTKGFSNQQLRELYRLAPEMPNGSNRLNRPVSKDIWEWAYNFEGKVIKLTNRNEILAKSALKKPLKVNAEFYVKEKVYTMEEAQIVAKKVALLPVDIVKAIALFPICLMAPCAWGN